MSKVRVDALFEIQAAARNSWEHMAERLWDWDSDKKGKFPTDPSLYALSCDHHEDGRDTYPMREGLRSEYLRCLAEELQQQSERRHP